MEGIYTVKDLLWFCRNLFFREGPKGIYIEETFEAQEGICTRQEESLLLENKSVL
jgi:hypothetical protein